MDKEGIILVKKPKGITSHDVVDSVRKRFQIKKVGHAGTLDPLAEGLLIILVGRYTKFFPRFVNFDKEYFGVLKLGEATTTGDSQGKIIKQSHYDNIDGEKIKEAFSFFKGEIEQIPPMVSALRIKGERLYNLARRGIVIDRKPRYIKIYDLEISNIKLPLVEFFVRCSKGTYIRKLAEDIGERLGCGAHMVKILRLSVGPFRLDDAVEIDKIDESNLQKIAF
ncbi:MAG: tRNA pseudouridine(55) synthase TruB [Candidatus Omnitrophica bacterium]|jgi:tRNA pseudouridine55 synthase|nr:tRNA pseudouridine(55) synthase TruB [Candidatus Omnitrophota bacterium]